MTAAWAWLILTLSVMAQSPQRAGGKPSPANGKILWQVQLGSQLTNSPQTYMLDGRQYITVAAGDSLFAFYLQ